MGSCQPIRIALGSKTKKAINKPLIIEFIFKSIVAIRNPTTIHIVNADKFASQVRFCRIIGITSIIPATIPNNIPILIFFTFIFLQFLHSANIATNSYIGAIVISNAHDNKGNTFHNNAKKIETIFLKIRLLRYPLRQHLPNDILVLKVNIDILNVVSFRMTNYSFGYILLNPFLSSNCSESMS